jgi:hypothetical protein
MGPKTRQQSYLQSVEEAMRKSIMIMREKEAERLEQELVEEESENAWTKQDIADFKYDAEREA